jgi:hypothetical protein
MKGVLCLAAAVVLAVAAIASAQPFAYIVNSGTRNFSVVDTATDKITAVIPLPDTAQYVPPYACREKGPGYFSGSVQKWPVP